MVSQVKNCGKGPRFLGTRNRITVMPHGPGTIPRTGLSEKLDPNFGSQVEALLNGLCHPGEGSLSRALSSDLTLFLLTQQEC